MKCPFCYNQVLESNSHEKKCLNCHAEFEIDDREECVFANPGNLKLPLNGTVCSVCGLVQGETRDSCVYCGAALSISFH